MPLGAVTMLAAWRILREAGDPARGRVPDLIGAGTLAVAVEALALAIVEGGQWGWAGPGVVGAALVPVLSRAVFWRRATRHPVPVIEPALLGPRATRVANASVFLFTMGFFPLLLASALFMTEIWHYSVLEAGLAIAPGPLMAAPLSCPAGSFAGRGNPRRVVVPGVALFVAGCLWTVWRANASPDYLWAMLPALILGGVGVSLTFPVLAGAAVSRLPAARSAPAARCSTCRARLGGVVGIAIFVAILGSGAPTLAGFHAGWLFMAGCALAAGVAALALPAVRVPSPDEAVGPPRTVPATPVTLVA